MSFDYIAFIRRDRMPTFEELARRVAPRLRFEEPVDLLEDDGFVPVVLDAAETGFDTFARDTHPEELLGDMDSDVAIVFVCHDEVEIQAARIVGLALVAVSGGWLCDPQTGDHDPPVGV